MAKHQKLKICFISNYINHHQIPFCNAMCSKEEVEFSFIQTEPMEEERTRMGWQKDEIPSYVHCFYEEPEWCRKTIADCDVALFGGCEEEHYVQERLEQQKIVVRISERLYKTGQWKAVSPRGLRKKFADHTRYRKNPVYLLCAGAYVASDFSLFGAYPGKKRCWGYFPETKRYDIPSLLAEKGYVCGDGKIPYLLWAGRFIHWKHPEYALEAARHLKEKGLRFQLDMIGGGDMEAFLKERIRDWGLEDCVHLLGYKKPEEVRSYMEKANIFLFTSDRQEGWGAVLNEAMNSACAVAANHLPGAVPYLLRQGENGLVYRNGRLKDFLAMAEELVRDEALCQKLGAGAYRTITETWNAENAADRLMEWLQVILKQQPEACAAGNGYGTAESLCREVSAAEKGCETAERLRPCAPAPMIQEYQRGWLK